MKQGGVLCSAHVCHCRQASIREADAPHRRIGQVWEDVHDGALRAGEDNREAVSGLLECEFSGVECSVRESTIYHDEYSPEVPIPLSPTHTGHVA